MTPNDSSRDFDASFEAGHSPASESLKFTGSGAEYFGIWLSNLVLSLITLGIYSAWAKVRQKRYFLGHTKLCGTGFEYHATGWQLLKGRLLALVVIATLTAAELYGPPFMTVAVYLLLLPALPWLLNLSFRFQARVTAWRNVRFDWDSTYSHTFRAFVLWSILGVLSLGLLMPVAARAGRELYANHHSFGGERFSASTYLRPYYIAAFVSLTAGVIFTTLMLLVAGTVATVLSGGDLGAFLWRLQVDQWWRIGWVAASVVIVVLAVSTSFTVLTRNIMVNALRLGRVAEFHSTLPVFESLWIVFSNIAVTILSVGLLSPWAQVRWHRFQVEHLAVTLLVSPDRFVDATGKAEGAFGEEFVGLEGLGPSF